MVLKQTLLIPPPIQYKNNGDGKGHSFKINDAVIMQSQLTFVTTHTTEICIVVKICNGLITIKDSNNILYLVVSGDITYIGYKTECVITKDSEVLLNL